MRTEKPKRTARSRVRAGGDARWEAACAWTNGRGHGAAGPASTGPSRHASSGCRARSAAAWASTERSRAESRRRGWSWRRCRRAEARPAPDRWRQCSPRRSRRPGPRPRSRSRSGSAWRGAESDAARVPETGVARIPVLAGREVRHRRCPGAVRVRARTAAAWARRRARGRKGPAWWDGVGEVCPGRSSRAPGSEDVVSCAKRDAMTTNGIRDLRILVGFGPRLSAESADNLGF